MIGTAVDVGMVTLVIGIAFALYRIMKGPHVTDRVLAADVLSVQVVGIVILLAIDQQRALSLDAALLVAIVGFASTLAFAHYVVGVRSDAEPPDDGAES
jgi:multicomponent K+:H+ antiporter subunit F